MMSVVKALKCNYPILRPTAWYWNSFVVGLGFLFQLWVLYNTLHWSHLKDNRKKRQTCKTTNEFHFKVSDKLQPVERLFLWQYGVLKLEFVTSLFVLSTGEPKLFLFFFPSFSQDEWHLSLVTSSLRISGRASLYEVGNFEDGDSQLYNFLHSCVIKIT